MNFTLASLWVKLGLTVGVLFNGGQPELAICDSQGGGFIPGQANTYVVDEIKGNEVYGTDLSYDGTGVFLYKEEIGAPVAVGDTVRVVWGEEEDEFQAVNKIYGCGKLVK